MTSNLPLKTPSFVISLARISKILVPIDGSSNSIRGLEHAIRIAKPYLAKITLLHVIPGIPPIDIIDTISDYRTNMKKRGREFFLAARKTALKYRITLKEKIIFGVPRDDIADFANREKYDLVVIGARGLGSIKQAFLGSVSNATMHKSKAPVLIVK